MKKEFNGVFYFEKTNNFNLIGEFSNNESIIIMTESAIGNNVSNDFEGEYTSTWFDFIGNEANLVITKNGRKYKLTWFKNGETLFIGEGFVTEHKLIGFYKKVLE